MKKKIRPGQIVFLEPTIINTRFSSKDIIEAKVTKVGRKYFYVENRRNKFDLETMREVSNYCSELSVYLSKQEIEDKNEKADINNAIGELFGPYGHNNLSLEQLKKIKNIIWQ